MNEEDYEKLTIRNFKFSIIRKNHKKCIVSKILFYLIGIILMSSMIFLETNFKLDVLLISSFIFYLLLSKIDRRDNVFFQNINGISIGIVFSTMYYFLGIQNQYSLFLYFIGMSVLLFYNNRDVLILYSVTIIVFNLIYGFIDPGIYLYNHSVSMWFYFSLFYFMNLIINLIYIYRNNKGEI